MDNTEHFQYSNENLRKLARGVFMYEVAGEKRTDFNQVLADFADILAVINTEKPGALTDAERLEMTRALLEEYTRATGQRFDPAIVRSQLLPMLVRHGKPTPQASAILTHLRKILHTVPD